MVDCCKLNIRPMDLISGYGMRPLEWEKEEREGGREVFHGEIAQTLFYKIHEEFGIGLVNFSNPQIEYQNRLDYRLTSIEHYQAVEFSLFLDSLSSSDHEYWFEVSLDLSQCTIRVSCKVLNNGLPLKAPAPSTVHLLIQFCLQVFSIWGPSGHNLRVNPLDGTVKFSCVNFLPRRFFLDRLTHSAYLCAAIKAQITRMQELMDSTLLGKMLEIYNQVPFSSILPSGSHPLYDQCEARRIGRIEDECDKTSEYSKVSDYNQRWMCCNTLAEDGSLKLSPEEKANEDQIRFMPMMMTINNWDKLSERSNSNRKKPMRNISSEYLPFFRLFRDKASKSFNMKYNSLRTTLDPKTKLLLPKDPLNTLEAHIKDNQNIRNKHEIIKIRKYLRVQQYTKCHPNVIYLKVWKILQTKPLHSGFGGEVSTVRCEVTLLKEVKDYEKQMGMFERGEIEVEPTAPVKLATTILKKYEDLEKKNRRLWRQKIIVGNFQTSVTQCQFIHRYYQCEFEPECKVSSIYVENSLFMEYQSDKNLSTYFELYRRFFSLPTKLTFIAQILTGLRYLRDRLIFHLDVKPDNVLVRINNNTDSERISYCLKLIDFGESHYQNSLNSGNEQKVERGSTIPFASPEQSYVSEAALNKMFRTDIFAIGVIILIFFFDLNTTDIKNFKRPTFVKEQWNSIYSICVEKYKYYGPRPQMLALLEIAFACLETDSKLRPSLDWLTVIIKRIENSISFYNYHNDSTD